MLMSPGSKPLLLWTDDTLCVGLRCSLRHSPKGYAMEMWLCVAVAASRRECRHTQCSRLRAFTSQDKKREKKGLLDHSDGMGKRGNAKSREMRKGTKWFSCYSCCCFFALCAGFVGCLQPVHGDKTVQRNGSQ